MTTTHPLTGEELFTQRGYEANRIAALLPPVVQRILRLCPGVCVAGGFVRDQIAGIEPKDVDVFFLSDTKDVAYKTATRLLAEDGEYALNVCSAFVDTWVTAGDTRGPIQLIHGRSADTYYSLLRGFDFTCCQNGLRFVDSGWELFNTEDANIDAFMRELKYDTLKTEGSGWTGTYLKHLLHLLQKGYKIADYETLVPLFAELADEANKPAYQGTENYFRTFLVGTAYTPGDETLTASTAPYAPRTHPAERVNEQPVADLELTDINF